MKWRKRIDNYLKMAGDDETAFLAAGHVEPELLLRRKSKEFPSEASHLRNEIRIDAVINNLENPPVLAGLDDFPANLIATAGNFVDSLERDDRNFVAEIVVGHLGTFIFVSDEARLKSRLACKSRESSGGHGRLLLSLSDLVRLDGVKIERINGYR